ncbi:hypothetical protein EFS38_03055 [Dickeya undicola]|uniref:KAP NTPase domain-containing protein n=1 Tax=Dickeya undicola TaxID=1577887 RepID=A0ABX9WXE0_9GAMM|nr:P-loop NTPase fold protein [Dickeya undicola]RNM26743.1 hypothetical protein EFS38_03055 [Dickeya undicola]
MSIANVEKSISIFMENNINKTLFFYGEWGCGKTFFIKEYLSKYQKTTRGDKYLYVSTFGAKSIEEIKNNLIDSYYRNVDKGFQFTNTNKIKSFVSRINPTIPHIDKDFIRKFINNISIVKNMTICIDDIERKHSSLEINEIFAIASYLIEENNCKVIFILNENELEEKDLNYLGVQSEKIHTIRIKFNPEAKESLDIAMKICKNELSRIYKKEIEMDEFNKLLSTYLEGLNIINIRVICNLIYYFFSITIMSNIQSTETLHRALIITILIFYIFGNNNTIWDPHKETDKSEHYKSLNKIYIRLMEIRNKEAKTNYHYIGYERIIHDILNNSTSHSSHCDDLIKHINFEKEENENKKISKIINEIKHEMRDKKKPSTEQVREKINAVLSLIKDKSEINYSLIDLIRFCFYLKFDIEQDKLFELAFKEKNLSKFDWEGIMKYTESKKVKEKIKIEISKIDANMIKNKEKTKEIKTSRYQKLNDIYLKIKDIPPEASEEKAAELIEDFRTKYKEENNDDYYQIFEFKELINFLNDFNKPSDNTDNKINAFFKEEIDKIKTISEKDGIFRFRLHEIHDFEL